MYNWYVLSVQFHWVVSRFVDLFNEPDWANRELKSHNVELYLFFSWRAVLGIEFYSIRYCFYSGLFICNVEKKLCLKTKTVF
jgi:hypothetical protein